MGTCEFKYGRFPARRGQKRTASPSGRLDGVGYFGQPTPRHFHRGALLGGSDLILDGTDNFETRYLINDYAVKNSVAWIYSAAVGSYAVTMNILPGETACLACIFPESP